VFPPKYINPAPPREIILFKPRPQKGSDPLPPREWDLKVEIPTQSATDEAGPKEKALPSEPPKKVKRDGNT